MDENRIKVGDYVIIQRQGYTKLHKLKLKGTINLRKDIVELDNLIGCRFSTTFRMYPKPESKKLYQLEEVTELSTIAQLNIECSGNDNRHIQDDGSSQTLTKDEIEKLREESHGSSDIVEKLISNSKTFSMKTEYAQEKYMKKKERKYFEYIQVLQPSIRLMAEMFHRQDPSKIQGVRIDDLAQILTYSNVQSEGKFLLYDSGSSGLLPAAFLNAIGRDTAGELIHVHPGNECQKTAFAAMNFPKEQSERCVHVNLYSVLRTFHQTPPEPNRICIENDRKRQLDELEEPPAKRPRWMFENEQACRILLDKIDGLVIVAKEHPLNILNALIDFLKYGRSFVVFNIAREPLQELYFSLKSRTDFKNLRLTNNFLRRYQVLPNRTHPDVTMNFGGYLLTGIKVRG